MNNIYELPLSGKYANGRFAIIDMDDCEKVIPYRWCADKRDYVYTFIKTERIYLHRFIMKVNDEMYVDHKNHNKLDNRKSNLRRCTNSQNQANTKSWRGKSTKGVYFFRNKWVSRISVQGKRIFIGRFDNIEEAVTAYNEKSKEYFGEFAYAETNG